MTVRASVIMPTFNRLGPLKRALNALAAQTLPPGDFEVVVIDDGGDDATTEFLESSAYPFTLVPSRQTNAGPAAARNRGVALAHGPVLVFLDDDIVAGPELLERHVSAQERAVNDRLVVIGPMLNPPGHRLSAVVSWEQAMLYKQYDAMRRGDWPPTYRQFYTGNASMCRAFFVEVGGFDEDFRRAEDVEFAIRMATQGAEFAFDEAAVSHHYAVRSFHSWLAVARAYGRNDVLFDRKHPGIDRVGSACRDLSRRHLLTRAMTRACVGRQPLLKLAGIPANALAAAADRTKLPGVARFVLSGLYNSAYYSGMADELGGKAPFWARFDRP